MEVREIIARRAALELNDGEFVNLGFGMPTAVPNYLPQGGIGCSAVRKWLPDDGAYSVCQ